MKITKPDPTIFFCSAEFIPFQPMDFPLIYALSPPILSNQAIQFITPSFREAEAIQSIRRNCLRNCFYKNFPPYLWKEFFFPPLKTTHNSFFQAIENWPFWSTYKSWKAKIFVKILNSIRPPKLLNSLASGRQGIGVKKNCCLLSFQLLAWAIFI